LPASDPCLSPPEIPLRGVSRTGIRTYGAIPVGRARLGITIFALVVDAKDDDAVAFYQHLEFRRFAGRAMSLYLPIATALKAVQQAAETRS
jgi:hypothetical protein